MCPRVTSPSVMLLHTYQSYIYTKLIFLWTEGYYRLGWKQKFVQVYKHLPTFWYVKAACPIMFYKSCPGIKLPDVHQPYIIQRVLSTCCPTKLHTKKKIVMWASILKLKAVRTALQYHAPIFLLTWLSSGHKNPSPVVLSWSVVFWSVVFWSVVFWSVVFGPSSISCLSCFKAMHSSWNVVDVVVLILRNLTDQALI